MEPRPLPPSRTSLNLYFKTSKARPQSLRGRLLVVICAGDGRLHHHALWRQIQRGHKVSSGCEVQELWASEAPNGPVRPFMVSDPIFAENLALNCSPPARPSTLIDKRDPLSHSHKPSGHSMISVSPKPPDVPASAAAAHNKSTPFLTSAEVERFHLASPEVERFRPHRVNESRRHRSGRSICLVR